MSDKEVTAARIAELEAQLAALAPLVLACSEHARYWNTSTFKWQRDRARDVFNATVACLGLITTTTGGAKRVSHE